MHSRLYPLAYAQDNLAVVHLVQHQKTICKPLQHSRHYIGEHAHFCYTQDLSLVCNERCDATLVTRVVPDLWCILQEIVYVAVLFDKLQGTFIPNARDARNVIYIPYLDYEVLLTRGATSLKQSIRIDENTPNCVLFAQNPLANERDTSPIKEQSQCICLSNAQSSRSGVVKSATVAFWRSSPIPGAQVRTATLGDNLCIMRS